MLVKEDIKDKHLCIVIGTSKDLCLAYIYGVTNQNCWEKMQNNDSKPIKLTKETDTMQRHGSPYNNITK